MSRQYLSSDFPTAAAAQLKLDSKSIAALRLDGKSDAIFFDSTLPGFGLRLRAGTGGKINRSWIAQYRRRGGSRGSRRVRIGNANIISAEQARIAAKKILATAALGGDPQTDHRNKGAQAIAGKWIAFANRGIEPTCFLYRHYDAKGDLLYVGMSLHLMSRQWHHLTKAEWANSIYQIVVEPFATREELIEAEALAIKMEFPRHNKVHNDRTLRREIDAVVS